MDKRVPLPVKLIAALHFASAAMWVMFLLGSGAPEMADVILDDSDAIYYGLCLVGGAIALAQVAIGIGLWRGSRLALLGAIVVSSFQFFPPLLLLLFLLPLGQAGEALPLVLPTLGLHGAILGYLTFSRSVRRAFDS